MRHARLRLLGFRRNGDPHTASVGVFFADHWLAKSFGTPAGWCWWCWFNCHARRNRAVELIGVPAFSFAVPRSGIIALCLPRATSRGLMAYSIADEEIRLLKELKGAGDRGRNIDQARLELKRLMNVGYVKRSAIEGTATRCVITDFGRRALDNAMAQR
jgi:hypothetical protein